MPPSFQLEGIDCAHAIRDSHPDTGVVVLSAHDDEEYAIALLGKGHSGLAYLLKDRIAQGDELARAIREVQSGGSVVDPTIAERLSGRAESQEEDRIVLDMMAQGLGYEAMAAALGTTQEAVDGRVTMLFRRMAGDGGAGTGLLGEFKKLHAAVVEQSATATSLKSYVPSQFVDALARGGDAASQRELEVTILFSDIRGFSTIAERLDGTGERRDHRPSPRRDGRGDRRARRHDRQVPGRCGHGGLRCAGTVLGPRGAGSAVRAGDAGSPARAELDGVGDRRGRRHSTLGSG